MMKCGRISVLLISFAFSLSLEISAIPAYPNKIYVVCKDGRHVGIYLKGDEHFKYALSDDGYTLIQNESGWFYATKDSAGNMIASEFQLISQGEESDELKDFKDKSPKHWLPEVRQHRVNKVQGLNVAKRSKITPVVGIKRALVILVEFIDKDFSFQKDDLHKMFNEEGYVEGGAKGSVKDFFSYSSNGQLLLESDLYGVYRTEYKMNHYGGNDRYGYDKNPLQMVVEALGQLPSDIDLSVYDNDNNGKVDNVHVIFAGNGEEGGASVDAIWSNEYPAELPIVINGYRFEGYSCSPELHANSNKEMTHIGVHCHELSHAFGTMDYYDTNYSIDGGFEGTGVWDLMASGSWNGNGHSPSKHNPYTRAYDFGWSEVETITENGEYTIDENEIIRINTSVAGDYYLLEYRKLEYYDSELPSAGLLIYHHHPKCESWAKTNIINASHPQGFYVVSASCEEATPMEAYVYGDINGKESTYPTDSKTEFTPFSIPAAFAWDNSKISFGVKNIRFNSDGQICFTFENKYIDEDNDDGGEDKDENEDSRLYYSESFENGLRGFQHLASGWNVFPTGGASKDDHLIPTPCDGKYLLQLFTGSANRYLSADIVSPQIELSPDSLYTFSFMYRNTLSSNKSKAELDTYLMIGDDSTLVTIASEPRINEWTLETISIPEKSANVSFRFKGLIYAGGIFIDDVKIKSESLPVSVEKVVAMSDLQIFVRNGRIIVDTKIDTQVAIYSIDGKMIHSFINNGTNIVDMILPRGVYVISTDTGQQRIVLI